MASDEERDLGFGAVVARESRARLLNRDGTFNVERHGLRPLESLSVYHTLLTMTWPRFLAVLAASYVLLNVLFAIAYLLCGAGALQSPPTGMPEGRVLQAFFFSVETFATIGYGNVYPVGAAPNAIMTVEAFVGLLAAALSTGFVFARFARPTARIRFSRHAVIAPYRGITAFEFRIVNERQNQLTGLQAQVLFARFVSKDGVPTRQFQELSLERRGVTFFPLSWTIVHPIDEASPLNGLTPADLGAARAEFLVLLSGTDDTFSQTVHARTSYAADEVIWGGRFRNMFNRPTPEGVLSIDIARLDDVDGSDGIQEAGGRIQGPES